MPTATPGEEAGKPARRERAAQAWPGLSSAWPTLGIALLALPGATFAAGDPAPITLAVSVETRPAMAPSADLRMQLGAHWFATGTTAAGTTEAGAADADVHEGEARAGAMRWMAPPAGSARPRTAGAASTWNAAASAGAGSGTAATIIVADDLWDGVTTVRTATADADADADAGAAPAVPPTTSPAMLASVVEPGASRQAGTARPSAISALSADEIARTGRTSPRSSAHDAAATAPSGRDARSASDAKIAKTPAPLPRTPRSPRQALMAALPEPGLRRGPESRARNALSFDALAEPGTTGATWMDDRFDAPATTLLADASGTAQHSLETARQAADAEIARPGPSIADLPLRAYRYIPSGTEHQEIQRPPEEQRLMELNLAGDYTRLAREGRALLAQRKVDDQLRLIVANALAWTGELHAAEKQYAQLESGTYALDAKVGMANILRWRGKDDQALPLYREVLASMPDHTDALNAIAASEASLRPRSRVSLQGARDSDDIMVRELRVNHVWRTHEAKRIWDVTLHAMRDKSPFVKDLQSGLTVRHQRLDWKMRPTFELGVADTLYGSVSVTPTNWPLTVTAGRVNWGQMSYNPRGLQAGRAAWNLGAKLALDGRWGRLHLVADAYRIDDGNTLTTANARYQPGVRLPFAVRPVLGFEHRKSAVNSLDYWSPDDGYGLAFAGLEREWSRGSAWQLNLSVQRGWRLYGEAGSSWGAGLSGRVSLGKRWVLGANAWGVNNAREGRPYRARSVTAFLERRW